VVHHLNIYFCQVISPCVTILKKGPLQIKVAQQQLQVFKLRLVPKLLQSIADTVPRRQENFASTEYPGNCPQNYLNLSYHHDDGQGGADLQLADFINRCDRKWKKSIKSGSILLVNQGAIVLALKAR